MGVNAPMLSHGVNVTLLSHGVNVPMLSHGVNVPMLSHGVNTPILSHGVNNNTFAVYLLLSQAARKAAVAIASATMVSIAKLYSLLKEGAK